VNVTYNPLWCHTHRHAVEIWIDDLAEEKYFLPAPLGFVLLTTTAKHYEYGER